MTPSIKRISMMVPILMALVFSALTAPPARGANVRRAPEAGGNLHPATLTGVDAHTTDGVTILMHGWNPSMAGTPAWLASMRSAIAANFLGNEQNFGTITVTKVGANLVATCSPWNIDLTSKTTGGILIILDWSAVADHLTGGPPIQDVAAVVVDKIVTGQSGQKPLAELPIHLIGHSRGGALAAELAHQLGERGVVVDQLTLLDPHPLTASDPQPPGPPVIDTPLAVYENVVFADNYWQNAEYPTGERVGDAYNRQWGTMPGGYYNNVPAAVYPNHRNILLMYQGTVDLGNPVNNGEASMGATERAAWFNTYENSGDDAGFTYSRLDGGGDRTSTTTPVAGGDAIRAGLNNDPTFGGGGGRSALSWSLAVWPNVARLDVLSGGLPMGPGVYSITIGAALQLQYVYLDYDSGGTVTLYADADHNPYNGNNLATLSTQPFASATGGTYVQNTVDWDTSSMANGTTAYVYAKITDGARTRYLYAAPTLQFRSTNSAPTGIALSSSTVAENQPAGTTVGTLTTTDPDAGDTHSYSFTCAVPGVDDASFQIGGAGGDELRTMTMFDYETKNIYDVCIRSTDSGGLFFDKDFTITVTGVNDPPTDISLSNSSVAENQPIGTTVGILSANDQDAGDTHTYSLTCTVPGADDASFQIGGAGGDELQTAAIFDYKTKNTYDICIRTDDGNGGTFDKNFIITVTGVNDPPTDIVLSNSSVSENQPIGTTVGMLSTNDPDAGDTHTYTFTCAVPGADDASFQIGGAGADQLQTAAVFDYETKNSYNVCLRSTDSGGLFFDKNFTILVTDVIDNQPPTDISLSNNNVTENQPIGTLVGTFTTTDPDASDTHTYSFCGGADDASFSISGDQLLTAVMLDYETKNTYSICVRTDDGHGGTFDKNFTIAVTDIPNVELVAPWNGEDTHTNRPTFRWNALAGTVKYQLQVSLDTTFAKPALKKTLKASMTSYIPTKNLLPDTTYYWRVRAKIGKTYTLWSEVRSFTTGNPPPIPSLVAPGNKKAVAGPSPLFDWKDVKTIAGVTFGHYEIQISTDANFSTFDTGITTASQYDGFVLTPGTYYWRVRSVAENGDFSAWSKARIVTIS